MTTRDVKKLDIERPAMQGLTAEYIFCYFPAETFEAALCIVQPRQDQCLNDEVDTAPAPVTVGWFVIAHRASGFARSDRNVEILKLWRDKLDDLFYRHGEVCITHKTIIPHGGKHAALDRRALPLLTLQHT